MKVFLSSTYFDLQPYRNRATDALQRLDQQVGRMEIFGARSAEPLAASLEEVQDCDIFVGIYAHRYGFTPPDSNVSITEAEFQQARNLKKSIFCFVVDENQPWLPAMMEDEPGKSKLKALKNQIQTMLVTDTFTSPEDLALKIATSLAQHIARSFVPVVSGLRDVIEDNSNASLAARQACFDALTDVVDIANRTLRYIAQRRNSSPADRAEEAQLSVGWQQAGIKLLALPDPPTELANRYFMKAEYWSYPELWTDDRVESARIRLSEISEESRKLLLGLH